MDTIGKKLLHGFFGMIVGAGIGFIGVRKFSHDNYLYGLIGGAIFGAIGGFCLTDGFWENLKDLF